ncbi:autophagy-like protein 18 Atg18 [Cryptococcus neoformans c8]|nr:autophagy-like protein 18 Atg18 [Cryptococcus neoformans var. grubii AD1-83a]OXG59036.1 autophagy-like protein 18 Atg18 [Cryptococcus neoformans var. grubii MW-RSA1955]OXG63613.1 autophagy-like protein 18 Atg18 [Cryptococcus neoformans var. grubii c8]OXG63685.1 autophagy-like protein 18 Atg18 [Cryptococcus neoformans var. grubii CHC193]OXG80572.1 autophagy-like protein 18 Atg18 [Cryptococcus neoformans var. grubii MW-RSA36]OXH10327.1 autophagy-like protein 18 Atg18 [Cryptococcus neoformans 
MSRLAKRHPDLLSCNFNQDYSCIAVGHKKGYTILNCDPFGKVHSNNDQGSTGIVEMLFCTSLVALVGAAENQPSNSPRKLQIVNTKRQSTICELIFPTSVLAVKMNRKRLIVVLENEIYIYDISTMKLLHTIETGPNPNAVCALSSSSERSYLAYPSPVPSASSTPLSSSAIPAPPPAPTTGDVLLFDTISLTALNVIQAHKTPIASLALNSTGTMLATASDKGTVVRVFSVPDAKKLWQFRRGSSSARIFSINFNLMSTLLAVSSDTSTIHIYRLASSRKGGKDVDDASTEEGRSPTPSETPLASSPPLAAGKLDSHSAASSLRRRSYHLGKSFVGGVGGYLPKSVSEMWEPQRDFAFIKLRGNHGRTVVAMSATVPQVMVISSEGLFQAYNIDLENGGECSLMKEFALLGSEDFGNGSNGI